MIFLIRGRGFWLAVCGFVLAGCVSAPVATPSAAAAAPNPTSAPPSLATQIAATAIARNPSLQRCGPTTADFTLLVWPLTDFCRHSVEYAQIHSGGVSRDSIPAIDRPVFQSVAEGNLWLSDVEPVVALAVDGDARAYPLQVLVWHEVINDVVAGRPVVITYCPLCDSALAFERTVDGQVLDFGATGNLRQANLIMYDRQTESWWQEIGGEAIVGALTGKRLPFLSANLVAWADFKAQYPEGQVLFPDTGYERPYGETPYVNYDVIGNGRVKFLAGEPDPRLPPKRRVLGLVLAGQAMAYPFDRLAAKGVAQDQVAGQPLVVFWRGQTVSAVNRPVIADSRAVGSAAIYRSTVNGRVLHFTVDAAADGLFTDDETGSIWNIFGVAQSGPLAGARLAPLPGQEFFWFAWAAFHPDTKICQDACE